MVLRTVLKLDFSCPKCKKKLLKSVSGLEGIDKIELDAAKSTVTVTGNADPYEVIIRARKIIKHVEVLNIGPPPKPAEANTDGGQKKPEEANNKKPEQKSSTPLHHIHTPHPQQPCHVCQQMMYHGFVGHPNNEPNVSCSIL